MIGGTPLEPGLLDWVARSTGCDWHAAKKTTAAQNKWLWGPLRIGELINSATLSVGATAEPSRTAVRRELPKLH